MRIVHILHEVPFPPTSGIRCDMGRRLTAFHELGHAVFAVAWASASGSDTPSLDNLAELSAVADETAILPIGRNFKSYARRLWYLRRHPSYIAARIPTEKDYEALLCRIESFRPDVIWLEGIHPSWLAWSLKSDLRIPLIYRAHNIEHLYVAEQSRLAKSLRLKVALAAGTWGLEAAERRLYGQADAVFDISAVDLDWWRNQGYVRGQWLATNSDPAILATAGDGSAMRDVDLLFIGSLSSPNNIVGINWYLSEIHSAVVAELPDVRLLIAGRRPSAELVNLAERYGASILADPADASAIIARSKVMINPILHGSGVNIKTVDMLASGQPVVTTSKGARGLPEEVVKELVLADDPADFAAQVVRTIRSAREGVGGVDRRALIERVFGLTAPSSALLEFEASISS